MATLSGASWAKRFPTSTSVSDLALPFQTSVARFLAALAAAKCAVKIAATLRPQERAFLMHHAYRIAREGIDPSTVPSKVTVAIDWVHRDKHGKLDLMASRRAAEAMVRAYAIVFRPALQSNHTLGLAIDMTIDGYLNKRVNDASGVPVLIKAPSDLHRLGAGYGVHKLASDPPHWSSDGR